jgi:phosphotransferase system enzyme I (PtsI)
MRQQTVARGIAASPGIRMGKAYLYSNREIVIDKSRIKDEDLPFQEERVHQGMELAKVQLLELKAKVAKEISKEAAEIIEAHLLILDDPTFKAEIAAKIKAEHISAEYAVLMVGNKYIALMSEVEDEYLKQRAVDIKDVMDRIVKNILAIPSEAFADIQANTVIVAKDLIPSDTAQIDKKKVVALITEMGSRTSHTAIMARSLEIPAVVGLVDILNQVENDDYLIVDGNTGVVYINPDQKTVEIYQQKREAYQRQRHELDKLKDLPAVTKEGARTVTLGANIGKPEDIMGAVQNGAQGIGLFRTEFLYMDREDLPDEPAQFEAYKTVAVGMGSKPVIIRTLDIGGDKKLSYLEMPHELNPFLGYRAIRLCLDKQPIFKTQLRAILRASHYGNLKIMYPMISSVEEIFKANEVLNETKRELKAEQVPFDEDIEVGIMIEVPSAALIADILIKEVDFFSIGTNDLIQYTLAVDRMNEHVSYLYEPYHPAILRLIKKVIDAAHQEGKWTSMCGEMAGDAALAPILLGMGLDEFSMSAMAIPEVKQKIRSISFADARNLAEQAMKLKTVAEIRSLVKTSCADK